MISFISTFVLTIISLGNPELIKIESRYDDYDFGSRTIEGNGITLTWAPQGIGFPLEGTDWQTAKDNCSHLNEAGDTLEGTSQNIWRLPSKDEIVRSLTRKNQNAGGSINAQGEAKYVIEPDKETPLWNPHSQVIYYWTNESKNENQAFLVAYNGFILARNKDSGANYQGYRCVKE